MGFANTAIDVSLVSPDERSGVIAATDGELLMQFVRHRNQHAFAQIVERHGRLVWMVCRQVLRQQQDVEDAFQATFIILADRAATLRSSDSAAAWLFKVAQRTAWAARRKRWRRREEPLGDERLQGEEALPMICRREMLFVLMEELREMPERYQTPLVLRYLEGCSRRAIAEQTDSTVGQIQARLARGRRMLRSRLMRRGVSLSLAAGALGAASTAASAAVTPALITATATSCFTFSFSGTSGGASAAALELVKEGTKAMSIATITKAAVVAAIVLASGIVIASQQQSGDQPASGAGSEVRQQLTLDATGTTATNDKDSLAVSVADKAAPKKPAQTVRQPHMLQLQQMKEELRDVLGNLTSQKAAMDAELEAQELEEDLLKRELYHLHQTLNELKLSLIQSEPGAGQEGLQTQLDTILHQATQVKEKYKQQLQRTAELMAKLEQHEAERTNVRLRLDQLESLLTQLELQQQLAPGVQRAVGGGMMGFGLPTAISEGRLPPDTIAAQAADSPTPKMGEVKPVLEPNHALRIEVANAFADQPIDGIYVVEAMGTVPLGANYGRVKVAGLSILEAEEAIKRHLAEFIEDPVVQATLLERGGTTAAVSDEVLRSRAVDQLGLVRPDASHFQQAVMQELDQLHRQIIRLQQQNAELKKQLGQKSLQPSAP